MKRILFILTALFGLAILSFSQNVRLTGRILNKKNDPVVGATIQIEGSRTGTTSDVDGNFFISLYVGKKHTIVISSVNYETKTIADVEVIEGKVNEIQILLNESTKNTLTGVTVSASSSSALTPTTT